MLNFVDKSYFVTQTETSYLSIQADLNGFSFCITDDSGVCRVLVQEVYQRAVINYDDLAEELHRIFEDKPFLRAKYAHTCCMFLSNKVMLMPQELLEKEQLRICLERVINLDELDEIHFKATAVPEATAVYAIPSPLAAIVTQYHNNAVFLHQSLPLIRYMHACFESRRALLYVEDNLASIALFLDNRLVLSNTYVIDDFSDAIYYLTFALKEWETEPAFLSLYFTGHISEKNREILNRYYANVKYLREHVPGLFDEEAMLRYYFLLTLHKCE